MLHNQRIEDKGRPDASKIVRWTIIAYALVTLAWLLTWLAKASIDLRFPWLTSDAGGFVFWTIAKVVLWVAPGLWLIRLSGRTLKEVLAISSVNRWISWGGGFGMLLAAVGFIQRYLSHRPLLPSEFSFALLNVLFIAPVLEEFLFRGAILVNLQRVYSFFFANFIAALMFLGIHLPGWYFMGNLSENLSKPFGGALSIALLGLLFGYVLRKSGSVAGSMLAHLLNNFAS